MRDIIFSNFADSEPSTKIKIREKVVGVVNVNKMGVTRSLSAVIFLDRPITISLCVSCGVGSQGCVELVVCVESIVAVTCKVVYVLWSKQVWISRLCLWKG